ncbi:hypothetical protein PVK06_042403 [Gossypium arboreum]|uniref:Zinc knuckle CX2CX4HX4C domain-containing protein n=1 Tax=Gossypium arboreum TaxID=29729 RepID=A0ABR0MKV2_GOSAR|nr:hypothetical protein PVK06_042403 [Gossypium arboreum]
MDMDRVISGAHWTFNNHLLMIYRIEEGDNSMKVHLILAKFWVQIHDVLSGFFSEPLARQLGDFIRKFLEYDSVCLEKGMQNCLLMRVCLDVKRPLKRKKRVMFSLGICGYVNFKYERLTLFCFFCGKLRHSDSFCQGRMALGVEVVEMGWDLTLKA